MVAFGVENGCRFWVEWLLGVDFGEDMGCRLIGGFGFWVEMVVAALEARNGWLECGLGGCSLGSSKLGFQLGLVGCSLVGFEVVGLGLELDVSCLVVRCCLGSGGGSRFGC